jgi:hypothetical protein
MPHANCEPVPDDWRNDLARDNPEAWSALLKVLLPLAMRALPERFGLIQLHGGNELSAEAGLYSAWSSFQRHFHEDEFERIRDLESLAGHFIIWKTCRARSSGRKGSWPGVWG